MPRKRDVPKADSISWIGLCPCGCGSYYAMLLDKNEKPLATFGFDPDGWTRFMEGVVKEIKGESINGIVCEHHTAH